MMDIQCPICGQVSEVDCEIADGQSLLCPYCDGKFSYGHRDAAIVLPPVGGGGTGRGGERKGSLGRKKLGFIAGGVTVACVLVVACLTGHFGETPLEGSMREQKAAEESLHHYAANEPLDLDFNGRIDTRHVFGLRWGEKPRRKACEFPCEVVYGLEDGLFSEVKLYYGQKDGLTMVVLGKKGREKTREAASQAFGKMADLAKQAAGGRYQKVPVRAGWSGLPDDGNLVSVMFFERTLEDEDPERVFMVVRPR